MLRIVRTGIVLAAGLALTLAPGVAQAAPPVFGPGAPGIGDPYFPADGNGGYDVRHYDLDVAYTPATDQLVGVATIHARATQNLSRFDLDLIGLNVRSITVNGAAATFTREGVHELVVTPAHGLRRGLPLTVVVKYDGVPATLDDPLLGTGGFFHTADGEVVAGQPQGAATWFPVNDHPADKAAYTFHVTVPNGLEVLANGRFQGARKHGAVTTWVWDAKEPMASYLATIDTGQFDVKAYRHKGKPYVDGIAESLFTPFAAPVTGTKFALSGAADNSYKRLTRTISVPAGGATLSFKTARAIESGWDFMFVEAHTVGADDWTTLPDANGHTSQSTGNACLESGVHPFLEHYQTPGPDGETCTPAGTTGKWYAATGRSDGYQDWTIDLSAYAGTQVEVSIAYASDYAVQGAGVAVDDVVVSTGAGTTSFEADSDPLDGWQVTGPPAGSPGNENNWAVATAADVVTTGDIAEASLAREPEIIDFLVSKFGKYPFNAVGGIVPADDRLGFALETQTRPVYSQAFFSDTVRGSSVVVHELTHQWYGDSLALERWKDIWLNEGFASYAEWLWSEHEGQGTAQEIYESYAAQPEDSGFWDLKIGDPGPAQLFDGQVYDRGAMTLHALRLKIGDRTFFTLLKAWAASRAGGNVTTAQFIALAERLSGQDLSGFFQEWLYSTGRPSGLPEPPAPSTFSAQAPIGLEALQRRFGDRVPN
jgi:peptidase M1-like protein/immune inhibitor InhA-like protein